VWVEPVGKDRGQIERVEERQSVLSRQHPGVARPAEDVILANPDQVLIVFAIVEPEPHLRMLDRFLVIAEANELPAIICVNKLDLASTEAAAALFGIYTAIGYPVIYASTVTGEGVEQLRELLSDRVTVISGPSGVGKSSLLNALHPALNLQIGDLRDFQGKGKHTTRAAQLFGLPFGNETFVADTPGIRELGLYEIDAQSLGFYFREFVPLIHQCRYPNCTHDHEPECAVRAAVESGAIARERYESYLRLLHGEE
jgi:ribosome biogenesis GTPase / thiamine phosphate phosphatase